jgi:hypothetical protein
MEYTKDPAEQTTAATDLLLAVVAMGGILFLRWDPAGAGDYWKINIWSAAIGLIGLAAFLGAAAHGLVLSPTRHRRIWQTLNMALALAVSLFVAGVVYDLWGWAACLGTLPLMLVTGLVFFAATLIFPGIFFVFIAYEGLALIFALGAYIYLSIQGTLRGAGFIAGGILISIIAAAIQANKSIALTLVWKFDHNGIYHILQASGLTLLLIGLRWSMQH